MYSFEDDTPKEDREFFGSNRGLPMKNPDSWGMLKGGKNLLEMPCKDINRSVPYFEEIDEKKDGTMNDIVYNFFESISTTSVNFSVKSQNVPGLENVPDGMLKIKESNQKRL